MNMYSFLSGLVPILKDWDCFNITILNEDQFDKYEVEP